MSQYKRFAEIYDQLMDKSLYNQWAAFAKKYVQPGGTIYDMACGGGDLAARLERDYEVIGSDLSPAMVKRAKQRVSYASIYQANMASITDIGHELKGDMDLVTCFADSLCYLLFEDELQSTFENAYDLLKEGGYFLFDVHSIWQIEEGYRDFEYQYHDEDTVFLWNSYPGEFPHSVIHYLVCLYLEDDIENFYRRYDEEHYERTYPLDHYLAVLEQVGFKNIKVFRDFGKTEGVLEDTPRWFFAAQK